MRWNGRVDWSNKLTIPRGEARTAARRDLHLHLHLQNLPPVKNRHNSDWLHTELTLRPSGWIPSSLWAIFSKLRNGPIHNGVGTIRNTVGWLPLTKRSSQAKVGERWSLRIGVSDWQMSLLPLWKVEKCAHSGKCVIAQWRKALQHLLMSVKRAVILLIVQHYRLHDESGDGGDGKDWWKYVFYATTVAIFAGFLQVMLTRRRMRILQTEAGRPEQDFRYWMENQAGHICKGALCQIRLQYQPHPTVSNFCPQGTLLWVALIM